ncbi:MAG: protein-tyrosine-phosphatase [Flammeovirgaceae bacterium]
MTTVLNALATKIQAFEQQYEQIPQDRQAVLKGIAQTLTQYLQERKDTPEGVQLIFVCTHNSRRSHIAQLWAQGIAYYYGFHQVRTYSGGTEATAFFLSAVQAMQHMGFQIEKTNEGANPLYEVHYAQDVEPIRVFSKVFDHESNPQEHFAAVMTCSHADENCPYIPGAEKRIPLLYDDPKAFDGTPIAQQKYDEKAEEIGRELTFIFEEISKI